MAFEPTIVGGTDLEEGENPQTKSAPKDPRGRNWLKEDIEEGMHFASRHKNNKLSMCDEFKLVKKHQKTALLYQNLYEPDMYMLMDMERFSDMNEFLEVIPKTDAPE